MKMLVVADTKKYSRQAAQVAARFAANTWADVTVLGLQKGGLDAPRRELADALAEIQDLFIGPQSPYGTARRTRFKAAEKDFWIAGDVPNEGRKRLQVAVRGGDPLRAVNGQLRRDETDFLVLGASADSEWDGDPRFPQRTADSIACSSLVVKSAGRNKTLVCCMDEADVSQESLEIINQLVTIHDAELKIVGLTGPRGLREEVEKRIAKVLRYYAKRNIRAWVRLVDADELPAFAREASRTGMLGLWLGKKSLLSKIFSKDRLEQLVTAARSSVLILK